MCAEHIVDYTCTQADPGAYFAHPQAGAAHLRHPADTAVDTLPYPQDAATSIVGFGSLTKLGDPNNLNAKWICLPLSVGFARNVTKAQLLTCPQMQVPSTAIRNVNGIRAPRSAQELETALYAVVGAPPAGHHEVYLMRRPDRVSHDTDICRFLTQCMPAVDHHGHCLLLPWQQQRQVCDPRPAGGRGHMAACCGLASGIPHCRVDGDPCVQGMDHASLGLEDQLGCGGRTGRVPGLLDKRCWVGSQIG